MGTLLNVDFRKMAGNEFFTKVASEVIFCIFITLALLIEKAELKNHIQSQL